MSAGMGISAGTNIVGGAIKALAAAKAQEKAFASYQNELARQRAYATEATGGWQQSLQGATADAARQQMEAGRQQRLQDFSNIAQVHLMPGGGSPLSLQDNAKLGAMAQSRAKLGSYSDWALNQTIRDIKTQQELNRVSDFARGTAGVFPYRQEAALHNYDWLALIGNSIQQLGGAGGDVTQYFQSQAAQRAANQPYAGNPAWAYGEEDWSAVEGA